MEERIAALERSVRWLRRALYAALAGVVVLGGLEIAAARRKPKPVTKLFFEEAGRKLTIDANGIYFSDNELRQSTHMSAGGVFAEREDDQIGARSSSLSAGVVASSCEGSTAQLTSNKLGAELLITDTKQATASLSASQGMGRLHLWAQETRVEMTAEEAAGNLMLQQGSKAELSASEDEAVLELETHPAEKRISSFGK